MNPIILTLIIIYLIVILTKNVFSNKELAASLPPGLANVVLFIRKYMNDIFITIFLMLGMMIYFAMAGVTFDGKPKVTLEKEVTIEKFSQISGDKNENDHRKEWQNLRKAHKEQSGSHSMHTEDRCRAYGEKTTCLRDQHCGWFEPSGGGEGACTAAMAMTENGHHDTLTTPYQSRQGKIYVSGRFGTCRDSHSGCVAEHSGISSRWGRLEPVGKN